LLQFGNTFISDVMSNGIDPSRLSGKKRWFLSGYRVTLPFVMFAMVEQLSRYGDTAIAATMGSTLAIILAFWLLTMLRPSVALATGAWVISAVAWLAVIEGSYLVFANPPVGGDLMRETTFWVPIICAYWAMIFHARPRLAIAMVALLNIVVLATDLYVRVATGHPVLNGSPVQAVLQIVILVVMVWVFGGVHNKVVRQRNVARTTAIRDPLTGLHNRLSFEYELRRVAQEADRYGYAFGLIIMDIDHFKRFNDEYGHLAGDAALQTVARTCRGALRKTDLLSRWGGEEFAIIIHHATADQVFRTAEKLRLAVAGAESEAGEPITISCGVALYRENEEPRALFERADAALMLAKEHGRNRVMCCPMSDDETLFGPPP
jgi:diguanylate cyclase (GGDEF)-like protein